MPHLTCVATGKPAYDRGCYGCFGPMETPNTAVLSRQLIQLGMKPPEVALVWRGFNAEAEPFRKESEAHAEQNDQS